MVPVLLDTDIGSDVDDAFALAYLLRQSACELLGVTTATGDTHARASLASWLCREAGRPEISVVPGLEGPLLTGPGQPEVPQLAAMPDPPPPVASGGGGQAVDFLRDVISARPGEVTLVAVGPLTNIGALFAVDPEIPGMLRQIVLMGGTYGHTYSGRLCHTEWNAHCDPLAAALVFRHASPGSLLAVGLDVTLECRMPSEEVHARLCDRDPLLSAVLAMERVWSKRNKAVVFHDPLAAALVFRSNLCQTEPGQVDVSLDLGVTRWTPRPDGLHHIAGSVDVDAFFDEYFQTVER